MCVFLLSGNINAAWYRDNVSRQVAMPFMPRHLLSGKWGGWGGGCGGVYFSMPIQLFWLKMFCTQISNRVACHASCYVSHWVCLGYIGVLHEKQGITASKCCVTVLSLIQKQNNIQHLSIQNVIQWMHHRCQACIQTNGGHNRQMWLLRKWVSVCIKICIHHSEILPEYAQINGLSCIKRKIAWSTYFFYKK